MTKEEVEKAFGDISPYYAYKQGVQDGIAYNEESFRREAAKDILSAVIEKKSSMCSYEEVVEEAIKFADELIKQLRYKDQ